MRRYFVAFLVLIGLVPWTTSALVTQQTVGNVVATPKVLSCPRLFDTITYGMREPAAIGQVTDLQTFLADYFNLDESEIVTGYFGKNTKKYVIKFQKENGLPAQGIVGSMTRVRIMKLCGGSAKTAATTSVSASSSVATSTGGANFADIEQFREAGASRQCANLRQPEDMLHVAYGKIVETSSSTSQVTTVLVQDDKLYAFTKGAATGNVFPYSRNSLNKNLSTSTVTTLLALLLNSGAYSCSEWTPDASLFVLPTNIQFVDVVARAEQRKQDGMRFMDILQLHTALEIYRNNHGKYPQGFSEKGATAPGVLGVLLADKYMSVVPTDPVSHELYGYASRDNGNGYVMSAHVNKDSVLLTNDVDGTVTTDGGSVDCSDENGTFCVLDTTLQ